MEILLHKTIQFNAWCQNGLKRGIKKNCMEILLYTDIRQDPLQSGWLTVVQAKHVISFMYFSIQMRSLSFRLSISECVLFWSLSLFCLRHSLEHIKNVFGYEMLCHVVSCRWWIHFVYFYACRWFGHHYQSRALDSFCLMLWMCVCVCAVWAHSE